jgi:integrase
MTHKKNKVSISTDKGMLRLRLPKYLFGEPTFIYLGLEDSPRNRIVAEGKTKLIEYDLLFEKFDFTLKKYSSPTNEKLPNNENIALRQIITEYIDLKQLMVSHSNRNYSTLQNWLDKIDDNTLSKMDLLTKFLLENTSKEQARRLLQKIEAAIEWGINLGKLNSNPLPYVNKIKAVSNPRIDPFTVKERDIIIQAFEGNHFYNLVQFLFFTGVRPSEAAGLNWEKINHDYTSILINQAWVEGELKPYTKDRKIRHFPINPQLKEILFHVPQKKEYIFTSKEGQRLDIHNLTGRDWKDILNTLPIRYRPPYCCRHTFITLCLQKNIPISQVAYWVGNSPNIILKHYAGIIPVEVPIL